MARDLFAEGPKDLLSAPEDSPGIVEGAIGSAARGVSFGLMDPAAAGLHVAANRLTGGDLSFADALAQEKAPAKAFAAAHPVIDTAAEVGGMLASPLSRIPGAGMGAVTRASPRIAQAVSQGGGRMAAASLDAGAQGAMQGAGLSGGDAGDTAMGAAVGAATPPVLGAAARVLAPVVRPAAQYLIDRGVTLKPGQIMGGTAQAIEDKAGSLPITGDAMNAQQRAAVRQFNVAAYNEALAPIGETYNGPAGHEGIAHVRQTLSNAYDAVLPHLTYNPLSDQQFTQDLAGLARAAGTLAPDARTQFGAIIQNEIAPYLTGNPLTGAQLKTIQNELGAHIRNFGSSSSANDRMLAARLRDVDNAFSAGVERANPAHAGQLDAINTGWAQYARLRDAASRIGSAQKNGVFTPEALLSAVRSGDRSVAKGNFARGDALMQELATNGVEVLGGKYPDSGTAGRLIGADLATRLTSPLTLAPLAAGAIPYLPGARNLTQAALTRRPRIMQPVARAVANAGMPATAIGTGLLIGSDSGN